MFLFVLIKADIKSMRWIELVREEWLVELEGFKMKEQPGQQEEQTLRACTEKEESSCVTGRNKWWGEPGRSQIMEFRGRIIEIVGNREQHDQISC